MARGRSASLMIRRLGRDGGAHPDRTVVEEPMEIRLDDHPVATTMRTPGHDYELAAGFCFSEGLLQGADVQSIRYCATGPAVETHFNVVSVVTEGRAPVPVPRLGMTNSSCGICGNASIDALTERLSPLGGEPAPVDLAIVIRAGRAMRSAQALFTETGASHAAAAFALDSGDIAVLREDIGRHNAVDKVVGRLLLDDRIPARGLALVVSGRASFEIVQKAWAAGFALVAAVSGPSALAVEVARIANITLLGFVRDDGGEPTANLYAPAPRWGG